MQRKHDAILRAVNNSSKHYNILTAPTHEAYQTNLGKLTNCTFYMMQHKSFKPWKFEYRPIPDNHILLPQSETLPYDVKIDIVLTQNKFGQFQVLNPIAQHINVPLINIEHTLPVPTWTDKHLNAIAQMRGKANIFISEYSIDKWKFNKDDPSVHVIRHAIDSDLFKLSDNGHNDGKVLTVVNDYKNRDWCMPAGQQLLTDNGYVDIENIHIGNNVLTDSGVYHPVIKVFQRNYNGPMVQIYVNQFKKPLSFTTDHNIRVIRDNKEHYVDASRVRAGDVLKFPKHVQTDFSFSDQELSWLIGNIIGDGSITNNGRIEIAVEIEDTERINKIHHLLGKYTGNKAIVSYRDRNRINGGSKQIARVEVSSIIFATWIKEKIGGKSYNKSIPDFIMNSCDSVRFSVLSGMWACDGSFKSGKKASKRATYSTISYKLASQVSEILHSFGVSCNITREKRTTNKSNGNAVFIYRVNSYGNSFDKLIDYITNNRFDPSAGYNYIVSKVELQERWNGIVYNCKVASDPSYVLYPGFVAHNCCGWSIYHQITKDLPINPAGDTPGFSLPAANIQDLVSKYQNASVFLNTSLISPLPTALLEAMSCGCAVVTTATCMVPEVVIDGYNGYISNDIAYLREKLDFLLKNPEKAQELGKNARQTILEKFSLAEHLKNWSNIFDSVYGTTYEA